jgi:hypothetical protein
LKISTSVAIAAAGGMDARCVCPSNFEEQPMTKLELITVKGPILITEADLPLSDEVLHVLAISRQDFDRCFAEAKQLGVPTLAKETEDGKWEVIAEVPENQCAICKDWPDKEAMRLLIHELPIKGVCGECLAAFWQNQIDYHLNKTNH